MKQFTPIPCGANDAVLMVSSYASGALAGWLAHPRLDSARAVRNATELLFLLDELSMQEEAPVRFHPFDPDAFAHIPRIATIHVQILFREHYTWQGRLIWEDRQQMAPFHSALEMLQLLDEILAG